MQFTFKELSHIKSWRCSYVRHLQWTFTAHDLKVISGLEALGISV